MFEMCRAALKIIPDYSKEERKKESKSWLMVLSYIAAIFCVSCGVFLWGGSDFPPSSDGWWSNLRWVALLVAAISAYLFIQAIFELFIAATIGPERFFAVIVIAAIPCGIYAWIFF